ncbi:MBL fold metallo-hydrolase [Paenibacillus abyssi]|uniref:MBL fold hydrolase n=1 Tax=Paenibacillus abyssi TaxID=1340531 RepID=A0A917LGH0_9BACL|nr:MBL fold metallo-hydrolase [Paenibacillus abyssi]GGG20714.1 MBL fold hydrolase [Paenibacillus abyssi]
MTEANTDSIVWDDGWIQVKVPLPFSLKWVNSYLLPEDDGYTLIDPGLHTAQAVESWKHIFSRYGIRYSDIKQIVLTHHHPDHYGLAGWFQEQTGAPVYMSQLSYNYTQRLWGAHRDFGDALAGIYAQHGMPDALLEQIEPHFESFVQMVSPQPSIRPLELSGIFRLGKLDWQIIHTPGHANGHLCFYHGASRRIICGDTVLPDITPNVSIMPDEDEDPLQTFMNSLEALAKYEVSMAFPGHRNPFPDFAGRIGALLAHHDRRLQLMLDWLERPVTAFEVCELQFGERIKGNIHNLRFAMSETLAHLQHLVKRGQAREEGQNGVIRFVKSARGYPISHL